MTTLVIVESPSKAKKIGVMLGAGYIVQASGGHIRDLPTGLKGNGYDPQNLAPVYELTDSGKVSVKFLKAKLVNCSDVLLATDPDREGEAIAWHVAEVLGIKNRQRVKFHEITEAAVVAAVNKPSQLDDFLVKAQEARRIVDRMVGWLVSGPLSKLIDERASAGRVQSPALGLIVEREREIQNFIKKEFFNAQMRFDDWGADWVVPGADVEKCIDREVAKRASEARVFTVREFVERDEFEAPPAPFDTAVMQQAASVALGFDPEKTMKIAQKLFEGLEVGHGFITYHRTDDTNLSDEAFSKIQTFAAKVGLAVVPKKRTFKSAVGAQEAHEAIRPTDFEADVRGLSADELALYKLIHTRALASQMLDVIHTVRRARLSSGNFLYAAVGRVLKNTGWRALGVAAEVEDAEEGVPSNPVPLLAVGDTLTASGGRMVEGMTRAPGRYTKASLVKTLKSLGIGRPSTYAPSVDGLVKRLYVILDRRYLVPTPVAGKIYDALTGNFSFIRVDYTKKLEEDLDAITRGEKRYCEVVRGVYESLLHELKESGVVLTPRLERVASVDAGGKVVKCPLCKKPMVVRNGVHGSFNGCSTYPRCGGTSSISEGA